MANLPAVPRPGKIIPCPVCGTVIGTQFPGAAVLWTAKVTRTITVECLNCGADVRVGPELGNARMVPAK